AGAQLVEELDAALRIADDDVLEPLAEEPRERRRELLGRLDAIGDEAEHRGISLAEQGSGPGADTFEAAVQVFQGAQAVALEPQLVLGGVHCAFALEAVVSELLDLLLDDVPLRLGELLAFDGLPQRLLERRLAGAQALELADDRLLLRRQSVEARAGIFHALPEPVEARLRSGGLSGRRRHLPAQRLHLFVGLELLLAQLLQRLVFGGRVAQAGLLVGAQTFDAFEELFALRL